jgi:anti-sigma factor RsiW
MASPELDIACQDLVEIVTDYLEGALSTADEARFERHLEACEGCSTYLDQMRRTIELTGRLTEGQIPEPMRSDLLRAFRGWKGS